MIDALVAAVGDAFPLDESMRHAVALCALDRFQASDGIGLAADLVAEALERYGLSEVAVHRYRDPSPWWTFAPPRSWTPTRATLRLADGRTLARYPEDAMSLATYSVATPPGGIDAPLVAADAAERRAPGSIVVVDARTISLAAGIAIAERCGAAGVVAGPPPGDAAADLDEARARLELACNTSLFAFSVTRGELARLADAAARQERAFVEISIHLAAPMPLVEALLPGTDPDAEVLLGAHLCHPRPGANDNVSGVVGALGLARTFAQLKKDGALRANRRGVRFVLGPEFVGTAAYLHDFVQAGRRARPIAAINLDMIGEDQARCGGPLVVELPPEHLPSIAGALAEHCLSRLAPDAWSYSGAIPLHRWHAVLTPFAGGSDHAVHADRAIAVPAILIGHHPDRFNHTSADTIDKIDPGELRRAATVAGACALALAIADRGLHDELARVAVDHALGRLLAASRLSPAGDVDDDVFRPSARAHRADLIGFLGDRSRDQIASLERLTGLRSPEGVRAIEEQTRLLVALAGAADRSATPAAPKSLIERRWPGPFNVRGLLERATGPGPERLHRALTADRRASSTILALALAIDDRSSRAEVVRRAAYSSLLDIDRAFADAVFDAMGEAGWMHEAAPARVRREPERPPAS